MQITAKKGDILETEANLLAVGVYEKENWENNFVDRLNELLSGKFKKLARMQEFEGKVGQSILFSAPKEKSVEYILVLGLGKLNDLSLDGIREATGMVVQRAKSLGQSNVAIELFGEDEENKNFQPKKNAKAIAEAAILADYRFVDYKKQKRSTEIKELTIISEDGRDARNAQLGIDAAYIVADGVTVARDLVNTPANNMKPERLAEVAENIAKMSGGSVKIKILNKQQCEKKKMGAYLAVAQGSDEEPKFIHLTYKPEGVAKKKIALVGKGVTFDSGGLSIKSADGMMTMKCDMAGAGAVLGLFATLGRIKPKVEIHGIVAATENMPSGKAIRPGDIVRASNGKTIEILNTDAEGRLTLADALHYACKLNPNYIVDLATLTGACVVALGEEISGIMSNNPKFANQLLNSAAQAGEKMWEMPLEPRYRSLIESDIADLRNIAKSRYGGTLTAGIFLQEFVEEGMPWAHIDIAGPAFAEKPLASYIKKGASGYGVRTLVNFIESI